MYFRCVDTHVKILRYLKSGMLYMHSNFALVNFGDTFRHRVRMRERERESDVAKERAMLLVCDIYRVSFFADKNLYI